MLCQFQVSVRTCCQSFVLEYSAHMSHVSHLCCPISPPAELKCVTTHTFIHNLKFWFQCDIVFTSVDKLWKRSVTDKLFQSQLFSRYNLVMFLSVLKLFRIWILNHFKCWMSELRCIKFVFTFIVNFACNWKLRRQGFKFSKYKSCVKAIFYSGGINNVNK